VTLTVDPEVARRVEAAKKEKRAIKVSDFDDLIADKNFLNRLEASIAKWKADIREVTQK
jgi:hypothetical protein